MKIFSTACPRNCYSTCSFKVWVDKGRIVNFEPHAGNHSTPEGMCLKGLSYKDRQYAKERILHPLKREENGVFKRISWDEALELITEKLLHFRKNFGAKSILFYESSGMAGLLNEISGRFWELFGGATTTYGNLCWPAGLEATRLTLGENKHSVPEDLENARLIIMWGKNAVETNVQESIPLEKALVKGAKLIVIDPRRTPTAEKADLLIQPRPGTDGALALGIARIIIERDYFDKPFVDNYVLGFNAFRESLKLFTPEKVKDITSVPVEAIYRLAEAIGTIRPMTILPGYGMQRYTNGGQTVRSLLSLQVITGNIGKPGACWHYANLQSYVFDKVKEPLSYYPPEEPVGNIRRSISKAKLGVNMLNQSGPPLKMIWVERGNPVTQNPDTNSVLRAIRKLEFRVVVEQFMTDTAREADIVLPAKTLFEQSDIIGSYWNPYVQLKQKVVNPAGEVKPETEIYYLLGKKLGISAGVLEKEFPVTDVQVDTWLQSRLKNFPSLSLSALKKGPAPAPGNQDIAYEDLKFNTPSGKIELYSEQAAEKWGVDPLPSYVETEESVFKIKNSSKKAFYFLTPNIKNRIHSQFGHLAVIKQFDPEPFVDMNPEDAAETGIGNGDWVNIFNERGMLKIRVRFRYGLHKDCLSFPNGWWISEGGGGNFLSAPRETDMGHGTAFHDNLVYVEKSKE